LELDFGRYRIEGRIAAGGMGEVYRATVCTAAGVSKSVAIKLVRSDLAGQKGFAQLFVEEVRVAMALSHANVVQAFDVGKIDERWFLAMEFVEGVNLGSLLSWRRRTGQGPLPVADALLIAIEALKGLDYAHRRCGDDGSPLSIVHRDVSPGNILLSREGEVKVADFGVAKSTLRDVGSLMGTLKGKIPYMPPEQVRGGAVDRRADLYSLGVVLYEMVAGRRLFSGEGAGLIPLILSGAGHALDALPAPPELVRILKRVLASDVAVRYTTGAMLRQELERLAHQEHIFLSSAELAAQVQDAMNEHTAGPSSVTSAAEAQTDHDTVASEPPMGFDALLGKELLRVEERRAEPISELSIYTTHPGFRSGD